MGLVLAPAVSAPLVVVLLVGTAALGSCAGGSGRARQAACEESELIVASYNIRFDNPEDGVHQWAHRREVVGATSRELDADLLGMQEVLWPSEVARGLDPESPMPSILVGFQNDTGASRPTAPHPVALRQRGDAGYGEPEALEPHQLSRRAGAD
jgi:hypothetical protein